MTETSGETVTMRRSITACAFLRRFGWVRFELFSLLLLFVLRRRGLGRFTLGRRLAIGGGRARGGRGVDVELISRAGRRCSRRSGGIRRCGSCCRLVAGWADISRIVVVCLRRDVELATMTSTATDRLTFGTSLHGVTVGMLGEGHSASRTLGFGSGRGLWSRRGRLRGGRRLNIGFFVIGGG